MKKLLLVSLLSLAIAAVAMADVPNRPYQADQETAQLAAGGGSNACTIVYYNFCSGWIWLYSGFAQGDEAAVVYDLAADCSGGPCCHTGGFWYWRYTTPGYGFTVSYDLYDVDCNTYCRVGASLGSLAGQDPVERWNFVPGLGCATSDCVAVVATFDKGTLPYIATDNNESNAVGGPACAGVGVGLGSSVFYGNPGATAYCPPQAFADALGPVDIAAVAFFDCQKTATEDASWSDVKGLFR
ncbi:MAG: hypothetical protein HKN20_08420 [Gemmatimonadetes bacterium]|nr:hypothetical protein [Gemmatimonadota bacterium]